jgi:hypothetical protein
VGCGCRGRELGRSLLGAGWLVRGTTRDPARVGEIEAAGIQPAVADPDAIGTVFDQIEGVSLVYWLLGTAVGRPDAIEGAHGARLERLLEKLIDTPVRGFVYEGAGWVERRQLDAGAALVRSASERTRLPVEVVSADPAEFDAWRAAMLAATERLIG